MLGRDFDRPRDARSDVHHENAKANEYKHERALGRRSRTYQPALL